MSEWATYTFQLDPGTERKLRLDRIRSNTRRYYNSYRKLYDQMVRDGYDQFLPDEFDRVQNDFNAIDASLDADPETASNISRQVGNYITQLQALARDAKREFELREQQRRRQLEQQRQQARSELEMFLHEQIISFKDPIVRDFAYEQLRTLQKEYSEKDIEPQFVRKEKETLKRQLQSIRIEAESKAEQWKQQKKEQTRIEAQRAAFDIHCQNIAEDENENPKAIQEVLTNTKAIQDKLKQGIVLKQEEFQEQLQLAVKKADEAVMDEQCRKETVRAIINSLRKAGFVVDTPRRYKDESSDEVVVKARKPAGNQAEIRVTTDRGFLYKFDRYEGISCKKDIDKVLPMLQDIYGIKLSDKRVLWQNPDRISTTARPLETDRKEQKDG
jgi:chromosome segregation ATPase